MNPPSAKPGPGSSDEEPALPTRIAGRYAVKRLLGRGGFGAVYEAYDELENRPVALKVIRQDVAGDSRLPRSQYHGRTHDGRTHDGRTGTETAASTGAPRGKAITRTFGGTSTPGSHGADVVEAFKDEFRLLTQLHHPNLAEVYDFGRGDEIEGLYFTQELVTGETLTDYQAHAGRETIVELFVQLARALDYIHALGLVHGDIKPSNVLVVAPESPGAPPQAKLIDFGLARMLRDSHAPRFEADAEGRQAITVLGTPGFSAPEKVRGELIDTRSDIYSLAATMYTAIRGQRPFPAKSFQEALRVQNDWRPELAGVLLPKAGPVVAELVGRMLEPNPELRPQSTRSILLELLRREATTSSDPRRSEQDRREFARVLVEHLPFVDRAHYLELMLDKAQEVLAQPSPGASISQSGTRLIRTVILEAPEGMGKQRLLAELRREVQLGDGLFIHGSLWSGTQTGLGAFSGITRQLASALGERSKAVRAFSELVRNARESAGDEKVSQHVVEFLLACARERPYVLHLSDLSHAPESARTVFEELARAIDHNEAPLVLCATTQPHSRISPLLVTLAAQQVAEIWHLRPFTRREMAAVLGGVLGEAPILENLVVMLDKLTGGHPLSFRETMRVLIEEGILVRDADSWNLRGASVAAEELHRSLAQHAEIRLDGLGSSGWEIANVLYLIEAPISESALADLTDLRRERFRRTLDRLEGEGLLIRSLGSGDPVVMLAHESVREAIRRRYEGALDEIRLDLAARIEELAYKDPSSIFLRARLLDDASEGLDAADALEASATTLFELGQPRLAAQVLERLIARLRRFGRTAALARLLRAELMLLTQAAGALEDRHAEAAHYQAGILLAELLGDYRAQALFWLGLADRYTVNVDEDMELALSRLEEAGKAARAAQDPVLELRTANRRAEILLGAGEIEQSNRWSRKAMEIVDLPEASDVDKCHIIGVRLRTLALAGHIGEARQLHEVARPIVKRCPVVQRQSYLSGIAFLAVLGGDPGRSIAEIEHAIEELRAANLTRLLLTPLHNLGDLRLRTGDVQGAEQAFREAIRLASLYGSDYQVHLNRGFLGYALARLGQIDEGADLLATAKREMQRIKGGNVGLHQLRLLDAQVAHMRGQTARARRELEEMLADFHSSSQLALGHQAQEALAGIERDLGTSFITTSGAGTDRVSDPEQDTVRTKPVL